MNRLDARPCPKCGSQSLLPHCGKSKTCTWVRCVSPGCGTTVDFANLRATSIDDEGHPIRINLYNAPEGGTAHDDHDH